MAYDSFIAKEYTLLGVNFATAFQRNIRGPFNRRGRVRRVGLEVTTALTAGAVLTLTTTAPTIPPSPALAPPAAPTTVFTYAPGALPAPSGAVSDTLPNNVVKDPNNFDYILPANTDLVFALTPNGATGVADVVLQIDWF